MKAKAVIRLKFPSQNKLETIRKALEPEISKPPTKRSKGILEIDGNFLVLNVEARDTVALRAALNAYLRWINSVVKVLELVEGFC